MPALVHDLPRRHRCAINGSFKKVGCIDNLVLTGQVNDFEYFLFQVAHRMIEIIEDFLR